MVVIYKIVNGCCNTTGVCSCHPFKSATERKEGRILRTMHVIFILSYLMHVLGLVGQNRVAVKPYQLIPGGCFLWWWDDHLSLCSSAAEPWELLITTLVARVSSLFLAVAGSRLALDHLGVLHTRVYTEWLYSQLHLIRQFFFLCLMNTFLPEKKFRKGSKFEMCLYRIYLYQIKSVVDIFSSHSQKHHLFPRAVAAVVTGGGDRWKFGWSW